MLNHPGDPYSLQRLSRLRHTEALRRAERQRLAKPEAPALKLRATAAASLRRLADRVAPWTAEAQAAGGC